MVHVLITSAWRDIPGLKECLPEADADYLFIYGEGTHKNIHLLDDADVLDEYVVVLMTPWGEDSLHYALIIKRCRNRIVINGPPGKELQEHIKDISMATLKIPDINEKPRSIIRFNPWSGPSSWENVVSDIVQYATEHKGCAIRVPVGMTGNLSKYGSVYEGKVDCPVESVVIDATLPSSLEEVALRDYVLRDKAKVVYLRGSPPSVEKQDTYSAVVSLRKWGATKDDIVSIMGTSDDVMMYIKNIDQPVADVDLSDNPNVRVLLGKIKASTKMTDYTRLVGCICTAALDHYQRLLYHKRMPFREAKEYCKRVFAPFSSHLETSKIREGVYGRDPFDSVRGGDDLDSLVLVLMTNYELTKKAGSIERWCRENSFNFKALEDIYANLSKHIAYVFGDTEVLEHSWRLYSSPLRYLMNAMYDRKGIRELIVSCFSNSRLRMSISVSHRLTPVYMCGDLECLHDVKRSMCPILPNGTDHLCTEECPDNCTSYSTYSLCKYTHPKHLAVSFIIKVPI